MKRLSVIITLSLTLLLGVFTLGASAQLPVDLTTQLQKFLVDLRAGVLGVANPITTITATGTVTAADVSFSNTISSSGKTFGRTSSNGLWSFGQNSGASPIIEFNIGTAAPTLTSCGTGTLTTKSTNTAGEVTPTGASACTVTFGLPNWSQKPFCAVTMETVAEAVRISAISTTAFTVTFTTAANVFSYVCIGGV